MAIDGLRVSRAEAIVRSIARALDPYVALYEEQPEHGYVCAFCAEDRGKPHAEMCTWAAATLFVACYPNGVGVPEAAEETRG